MDENSEIDEIIDFNPIKKQKRKTLYEMKREKCTTIEHKFELVDQPIHDKNIYLIVAVCGDEKCRFVLKSDWRQMWKCSNKGLFNVLYCPKGYKLKFDNSSKVKKVSFDGGISFKEIGFNASSDGLSETGLSLNVDTLTHDHIIAEIHGAHKKKILGKKDLLTCEVNFLEINIEIALEVFDEASELDRLPRRYFIN